MEAVEVKGRQVPCRLSVLLARSAPHAVVLRRGPARWVQLLKWRTDCDRFEPGQWFKGRVYDRRSDLSPDGSFLIYFASKFNGRTLADREYTYAWTAVSRPPYFTALALWPKGDCWHGGGLFLGPRRIWLNHKPEVAIPHPKHRPKGLEVVPNPEAYGEDWPVWSRAWSATAGCSCRKEPFVLQGTAGGPSGPNSGSGETRTAPSYFAEARMPFPSGIPAGRTWSRFGLC